MIISKKTVLKNNQENKFYIKINLGFFESGEKSEQPTDKRRKKARDEGQVAQSKEIQTAVVLLSSFYALKIFSGFIYKRCADVFKFNLNLISDINDIFNKEYIIKYVSDAFLKVVVICIPVFAMSLAFGLLANIIQVGWNPTAKPLIPKFDKFNPINGFKKMFSMRSIVEFFKSFMILFVISIGIYNCLKNELNQIQTIMIMDLASAMIYIGNLCIKLGTTVGYYFIVIAILDYAYERYSHYKKIKMTKQEVKDEYKQSEGDPQIKGKIKSKMREISMRRMMQEVPNADVVITNPTHYAVAIKYDKEKNPAPVVVAKGADHLARRIKELAAQNNIELVENKPLARTLYKTVDIGKAIPPELYSAVAEVLAFVYKLKNKY